MPRKDRIRLDELLVLRGLAPSRSRARAIILAGQVVVGEHRVDKAGALVARDAPVRCKGPDHPYVSRAGVKLAGALEAFGLAVTDRVALDVGASTGGFTDCMLQQGAHKVFALDVGRGQLHQRIASDPRVVVLDGINARHLAADALGQVRVDLLTFDLSFISLSLVLPAILPHAKPGADWLLMVKPQFEVGRARVGKGGIVKNDADRIAAADGVAAAAMALGLLERGRVDSPLPGADGNREIFLWLQS